MKRYKAPYSPQFRQQMIELVQAGRNPHDLAKEFGCHVSSILGWVRQANLQAAPGALTAAEREELQRLRKQLRQVQMERDILAKATAWFANKEGGIPK